MRPPTYRAPSSLIPLLFMIGCALTPSYAAEVKLLCDLTPGALSVYDVTIETKRRTGEADAATTSRPATQDANPTTTVHRATLTRGLYAHRIDGYAVCAQMLEFNDVEPAPAETRPSGVESLERLIPDLGAVDVQFGTRVILPMYSPLWLPRRPEWTRSMMQALLDASSWPRDPVSVGEAWDRSIRVGSVRIPLNVRVDAIENVGSDLRCRLSVKASPPRDPPAEGERLISAESTIVWSVSTRQLVSLEGRGVFEVGMGEDAKVGKRESEIGERKAPGHAGPVRIELGVRVEGRSQRRLPAPVHARERDVVAELATAVGVMRARDDDRALKQVEGVLKRWPRSRWRPAAEELRHQIELERGAMAPMSTADLKQAMVRLLELWVRAEDANDVEMIIRCRRAAARMAEVNRPEIVRLLDDADGGMRAVALFALAFGDAPGDLARMHEACGDADAHVRRTAMLALAVRGSPLTDVERLLAGLGDSDSLVRVRACRAAAACVGRTSGDAARVRDVLVERLKDASQGVVFAAAEALMKMGQPADRETIRRAAEGAESDELRAALLELLDTEQGTESTPE